MREPLDHGTARRRIVAILSGGTVSYSIPHALEELEKDGLSRLDVANVLRCGAVSVDRFERGHWRYRVETQRMCVIALSSSEVRPSFG